MNTTEEGPDRQQPLRQSEGGALHPRKGGRPKKIDVQILRRKLLAKCESYLDSTALEDLAPSMIKAIGDVIGSIGPEFAKEDKAAQVRKQGGIGSHLAMPFPVDVPGGVLPRAPGSATPANGFPEVAAPSITSGGGIKALPPLRDAAPGLSPRE